MLVWVAEGEQHMSRVSFSQPMPNVDRGNTASTTLGESCDKARPPNWGGMGSKSKQSTKLVRRHYLWNMYAKLLSLMKKKMQNIHNILWCIIFSGHISSNIVFFVWIQHSQSFHTWKNVVVVQASILIVSANCQPIQYSQTIPEIYIYITIYYRFVYYLS